MAIAIGIKRFLREGGSIFDTADERRGNCRYGQTCHFYNINQKNDDSSRLRELYCVKWPEQCNI